MTAPMTLQVMSPVQNYRLEEKNQSLIKGLGWKWSAKAMNSTVIATTTATVASGAIAFFVAVSNTSVDSKIAAGVLFGVCYGVNSAVTSLAHMFHRNANYHLSHDKYEIKPL